jgi:hypothetical protein
MQYGIILRLTMLVTVALVAFGVHTLRSADREEPTGNAAMYHGQTPEGLLAAAVVRDGKVRGVYMRWRMSCERDRSPEIVSTIRFGEQWGDEFDHAGRRFSFAGRDDQRVRRGYVTRYDVRIAGRISDDGRTITANGANTETWLRRGRVADVCRSKDVRFTAHRGEVVSR